ncbi:hypothetical protein SHAb15599_00127 [Acinetobacter phage SH-Ab 15599]|nr:hypothetical protein SHAb15599_00127 [Acinetobacter phage SH-Ab 15599]
MKLCKINNAFEQGEENNYLSQDDINEYRTHPVFNELYEKVIGDKPLALLGPDEDFEDSIFPCDLPSLALRYKDASVGNLTMGDIYHGVVDGVECFGMHWDYTGLLLFAAGE